MSKATRLAPGLLLALAFAPAAQANHSVTITKAPPPVTNDSKATFDWQSSHTPASYSCSIDGIAYECSRPEVLDVSDGEHTFRVNGSYQGHVASDEHSWTVDRTAPTTVIDSHPSPASNSAISRVTFSSPDQAVGFECRLDGGAWETCASPWERELAEGGHALEVRAFDAAGNRDPSPAKAAWIVDRTPPDTVITSGPGLFSNDPFPEATFHASELALRYQCSLDGAAFTACASPHPIYPKNTVVLPPEGPHSLRVRAVDPAGNVDATPAQHDWTIDLTAPGKTRLSIRPLGHGAFKPFPRVLLYRKAQVRWQADGAWAFNMWLRHERFGEDLVGEVEQRFHAGPVLEGSRKATPAFGDELCLQAEALDRSGNRSAKQSACSTVPFRAVDGRIMQKGAGYRTKGKGLWSGRGVVGRAGKKNYKRFLQLNVGRDDIGDPLVADVRYKRPGERRTITRVQGWRPMRDAWLIARRCPACGSVVVRAYAEPKPAMGVKKIGKQHPEPTPKSAHPGKLMWSRTVSLKGKEDPRALIRIYYAKPWREVAAIRLTAKGANATVSGVALSNRPK